MINMNKNDELIIEEEIFYEIPDSDEVSESKIVKVITLPNSRERVKMEKVRTRRRTLTAEEMKHATYNVSKYLKKPWGTHKESFNPLSRIETKEDKDILKQIHLNLQLNSKIIPYEKDTFFQNLYEVQNFDIEDNSIWIIKLSNDGKFIATGGISGVLKVYPLNHDYCPEATSFSCNRKVSYGNNDCHSAFLSNSTSYSSNNSLSAFKVIKESAVKIFKGHLNDIIDICWGIHNNNLIITASLDKSVILWDITYDVYIKRFEHSNMVTCISFSPNNEEIFVSGCLDKIVRVWDISKRKVTDYINVTDLITSISFFPDGNQIVVGFHNGKVNIFDLYPKLLYSQSIICKNKYGKYSDGRKVTGIEFLNNKELLISTNDSRIRLFSSHVLSLLIKEFKMKEKFKGHENNDIMIKACYDENNDCVISASEDGNVYIWKKESIIKNNKIIRNDSYIMFRPFEDSICTCSFSLNESNFQFYQRKMLNAGVFIRNVIISVSDKGKLQVLVNPVFIED